MNLLVIDGQGGGMGRQLVENIKKAFPDIHVRAVGTNAFATQAMLKAGADCAATGENAVMVGCRVADIIVGPRNCHRRFSVGRDYTTDGPGCRTK